MMYKNVLALQSKSSVSLFQKYYQNKTNGYPRYIADCLVDSSSVPGPKMELDLQSITIFLNVRAFSMPLVNPWCYVYIASINSLPDTTILK